MRKNTLISWVLKMNKTKDEFPTVAAAWVSWVSWRVSPKFVGFVSFWRKSNNGGLKCNRLKQENSTIRWNFVCLYWNVVGLYWNRFKELTWTRRRNLKKNVINELEEPCGFFVYAKLKRNGTWRRRSWRRQWYSMLFRMQFSMKKTREMKRYNKKAGFAKKNKITKGYLLRSTEKTAAINASRVYLFCCYIICCGPHT